MIPIVIFIGIAVLTYLALIFFITSILQNIFNYWFVQFEFPYKKGDYKSLGGEFEYNSYLETYVPKGWRVESILM